MEAQGITPILNVSNLHESFAWFEKLGWRKLWEWGDPPGFGAVRSEKAEIFLCVDGQGGRGKGDTKSTFGEKNGETADKGVWMSMWVEDVDIVHEHCVANGIEIMWPPTDMEWGVREMHVRHPDGHVFRIGRGSLAEGEPIKVERVDVHVRLEKRLAALLDDLAKFKRMSLTSCMEEILLHTNEPLGDGVASPHTQRQLRHIQELKVKHGIDYDSHGSYRFVEE